MRGRIKKGCGLCGPGEFYEVKGFHICRIFYHFFCEKKPKSETLISAIETGGWHTETHTHPMLLRDCDLIIPFTVGHLFFGVWLPFFPLIDFHLMRFCLMEFYFENITSVACVPTVPLSLWTSRHRPTRFLISRSWSVI